MTTTRKLRPLRGISCIAAAVLTFVVAGLLYLLRFERVDNLGAYSTPLGDRLFSSHLITQVTAKPPSA
jgi:hypothetical protein